MNLNTYVKCLIVLTVTSLVEMPCWQASSETPLSTGEVSAGPFAAERTQIKQEIDQLEKKGVGVKPYQQSLLEIDGLAVSGGSEDEIQSRVDRLHRAVSDQRKALETLTPLPTRATAATLNRYCQSVQSLLKKKWIPVKGIDNEVALTVSVDSNGQVTNVELSKNSKGTPEAQANVKRIVTELKHVGIPPRTNRSPIKLIVDCCDIHGVEIAAAKGQIAPIDYGPFMVDLQRRIKLAWHPPKEGESKIVIAQFKVHNDGAMSNARLVTKSGVAAIDDAALLAVKGAAPFRQLPTGSEAVVDVSFTFDYKARGALGAGRRSYSYDVDPSVFSPSNMQKLEILRKKLEKVKNQHPNAKSTSH